MSIIRNIITNLNHLQLLTTHDSKELSYDWETTSLDYLEMLPVGISFCDGKTSWYIPFKSEYTDELRNIFNKDVLFIAHNQVFDLKCCYKFLNICPQRIFCTEVAAKLIDDTKYNYGLDSLSKEYLGFGKLTTWEQAKQFGYNSQQFCDYATQDSELVFQLYQIQKEQLKEQNLEYLFFSVEMPFQFVIRDMEIWGCLVDKKELEILASQITKRIYNLEEEMLNLFNKTHILQKGLYGGEEYVESPLNFNSPQILQNLIKSFGLEIVEKTDGKAESVSKESILGLISKLESELNVAG